MMRSMSVYLSDARTIKGAAWAARYPEKAADLYVVAQMAGRKVRTRIGPPTPENRERAERKMAEYRAILERRQLRASGLTLPTFAEAADEYVRTGLRKRAPKTAHGRTYQAGRLKAYFGPRRIDTIQPEDIAAWWDAEVEPALDVRTGRGYLNVLSMIFKHAGKSEPLENPVPKARGLIFAEIETTAAHRAANERNLHPLSAEEMARLLPAVESLGNPDLLLTVLLMYECGLRLGEATGLQWGDFWAGKDESDTTRHVYVQRSRRDGSVGNTKSGRSRKVSISRRLRSILLARQMAAGRPRRDEWVVEQSWQANIRERLDRACKLAGIDRHRPKDFRDTYASTLITHGIVLKWVSLQLGHAAIAVTESHYAAYMLGGLGYQNPWMVPVGCLPVDVFAGLDGWQRPNARMEAAK